MSNRNEQKNEQRLRELNEKQRDQQGSEDKQTLAKSDDLRYPEADHIYGEDS